VNPAASLPALISVPLADLGISGKCTVRDLWEQKDIGTATGNVSATVNSHGAVLLRLHPKN
jgi:alpha-galactosidase